MVETEGVVLKVHDKDPAIILCRGGTKISICPKKEGGYLIEILSVQNDVKILKSGENLCLSYDDNHSCSLSSCSMRGDIGAHFTSIEGPDFLASRARNVPPLQIF